MGFNPGTVAVKPLTAEDFRQMSEGTLGLTPIMFQGVPRNFFTTSAYTSATYAMRLRERIRARGHRFWFPNFSNGGASSIEVQNTNPITIKANLLLALTSGPTIPLTFGGQLSVTIPAHISGVWSDPIEVDLPQDMTPLMLTYVSVSDVGMKWPNVSYGNAGAGEGVTTGSDQTASLTGVTGANGYVYGPMAAYGIPGKNTRAARLGIGGDSIDRGATTSRDVEGLNIVAPISQTAVANIAAYGESAVGFIAPAGHKNRTAFLSGCTSWYTGWGVNDIQAGGITVAQLAARLIATWQIFYDRTGVLGYQRTITPKTTSTDGWVTSGNQAVASAPWSHAVRTGLNDWLRDGAPMLNGVYVVPGSSAPGTIRKGDPGHFISGILDWADIVETARNSGIFKAGYSFDGIHLNPAAYTAIGAGTDWSKLGIV